MIGHLHLLAGKIASGKSTLAQKLSEEHECLLLSEDDWLSVLFGPEMTDIQDYVRYSARLRNIMRNHVAGILGTGTSVVLDFPANTPETRNWMRDVIQSSGCEHTLHLLNTPDGICKERLHSRNASGEHQFSVSDEQFEAITRHFVRPAASEGFSVREYYERVYFPEKSRDMAPPKKLARDFNLICGDMPIGPQNTICDVAGVTVGHLTKIEGDLRTGFTAILPHQGNLFRQKLIAGTEVINGFGKSAGLMQIDELGTLESPILLTNTFGVGTGINALCRRAIAENPDIGWSTGTVNPVVMECNDGYLSDIQAMALTEEDANAALDATATDFEQGSVGAGTGMSAFGFKGGIGSSSRTFELDGKTFTLGTLVQSNFGKPADLVLPDGRKPSPKDLTNTEERGSVIIVMATDVPLDSRQLKRIARRGGAGLARLGAYYGNGSGDIAVAFSTAQKIAHDQECDIIARECLAENKIDILFKAAAETTQEAVLNSMIASPAMRGRGRQKRPSLADWLVR